MRPVWERGLCADIAFRIGSGTKALRYAALIVRDLDRRYNIGGRFFQVDAADTSGYADDKPELQELIQRFYFSSGVPKTGTSADAAKQRKLEERALKDKGEAAWVRLPPAEQLIARQLAAEAAPVERKAWGSIMPGMGCDNCPP